MDRLKVVDFVGLDPDDNLLIRRDALENLEVLECHPGYAQHVVGHIKLAYLESPFNTGPTAVQLVSDKPMNAPSSTKPAGLAGR